MSELLGIGLGAAGSVISSGLGMMNQAQQVNDTRGLMEHGANLAYRNWLRTNYGAQREQLEKAGMNVGLMYSQGGQGGQLNGGSSGSASQAPTFDMANAIAQNRAIESQIKVNEAQADKLSAEADKTRGVDTDMTIEQSKGIGLDNIFKSGNLATALDTSKQILENEQEKNNILKNEGKISEAEANNREKQLKTEISNKVWDTILKQAQEKNVKQQTIESIESIKQNWNKLDQEQQKIEIEKFKADFNAQYPAVSNAMGNIVDEGVRGIWKLFGLNYDENSKHKKIK